MAREKQENKTAVRWLDSTEAQAWRTFIDAIAPMQQALEHALAPFDITLGEYEVLARLSEQEGARMRMCDLAADLGLSRSGMTRRMDGLVRRGFVQRETLPDDRRVTMAVLAEDGMASLVQSAPAHVESVREQFVDVLSVRELQMITRAFGKLNAGRR